MPVYYIRWIILIFLSSSHLYSMSLGDSSNNKNSVGRFLPSPGITPFEIMKNREIFGRKSFLQKELFDGRFYQYKVISHPINLLINNDSPMSIAFIEPRKIAVGSNYGVLSIWDFDLGKIEFTLWPHRWSIYSLTFLSDKKQIVTIGDDAAITVLDLIRRESYQLVMLNRNDIKQVALFPDHSKLVLSRSDYSLEIWDLFSEQSIHFLTLYPDTTSSIAVTPDGKKIILALSNMTIHIWDVSLGCCLHILREHQEAVTCLQFSADGRKLFSGSHDQMILMWDIETGCLLKKFLGSQGSISCLAVSQDGERLFSGSADNMVCVWDIKTGKCIQVLAGHRALIRCIASNYNGTAIVSGSDDETIRFWKVVEPEDFFKLTYNERCLVKLFEQNRQLPADDITLPPFFQLAIAETRECDALIKTL